MDHPTYRKGVTGSDSAGAATVGAMKIAPALVMVALVAATFVIAGSSSGAWSQQACPEGTTLSADGSSCVTQPNADGVNDNVTTTTSCLQGVLSDDGQFCIVPRLDQPAPPATTTTDAPAPSFTG